MTPGTWHPVSDALADYAALRSDWTETTSIEAHVLRCRRCRRALGPAVPQDDLDRGWLSVLDRIDVPRAGPLERALVALHLRPATARLLVATPWLRRSWVVGTMLVLLFALLASGVSQGGAGWSVLLLVAPLLPVAGVATAFGSGVDPAYEVTASTPSAGFRLLALRCTAVLSVSAALCLLAASLMPTGGEPAAWLLPALGLTFSSLALSTWLRPAAAAGVVCVVWTGGAAASTAPGQRWRSLDLASSYPAFHPGGQATFLVLAVAAVVLLWVRRSALSVGGEP